jgi:ubiquinone/menaquinone biosynthesis C-methylase UbiE
MSLRSQTVRLLRALFAVNREMCDKIEPFLPQRLDLFALYEANVAQWMNLRANQIVLDVGSGRECAFARHRNPAMHTTIVALDVSREQLVANRDVDGKIVANVTDGLPVQSDMVDLIASRSVLEHIEDMELFVKESSRVLRSEGYFIHEFTSKFAPFALINQMLPSRLSKKLMKFLMPEKIGICGFPAVYDRCYYSALKKLLRANQLELVNTTFSYYQSRYWNFLFPMFVLSALYETVVRRLDARNLCAYLLIVARKNSKGPLCELKPSVRAANGQN